MIKKILISLLVVIVIMQFFRIDTTNPKIDITKDFMTITQPTEEVKTLLTNACYACHSNQTTYPWYAQIAPVSWWLKHHVNEGREHLNFSVWGDYSAAKADHKLEECAEEVEEGEMPLDSYTWTHGDAVLSSKEKENLKTFFESHRTGASEEAH